MPPRLRVSENQAMTSRINCCSTVLAFLLIAGWVSPSVQAEEDAQIILDYERNTEFMIVDIELGTMLDPYLNTKGHSAYIRPAFGVGADRSVDAAIEIGYKVIW